MVEDMIFITEIILFLAACFIRSSQCDINRAHKVHNIVLYPDRSSWCNATRIIQIVNHPGCNTVKIDNNVCVGTCFSYVVPHTIPSSPGYVEPYCDSCQPLDTTWKHVTLECNEGEYKGKNISKYMEIIESCSCQTCLEKPQPNVYNVINDHNDEEIDAERNLIEDSQSSLIEGYDMLLLNRNFTNSTVKMLNKVIDDPEYDGFGNFLKKLENNNDKIDFGKLMQMKKKIEEDLNIKPKIRHIQESLSTAKRGCKEIDGQGPHHSSFLSKDCYETYPNFYQMPRTKVELVERETTTSDGNLQMSANSDLLKTRYPNNGESSTESEKTTAIVDQYSVQSNSNNNSDNNTSSNIVVTDYNDSINKNNSGHNSNSGANNSSNGNFNGTINIDDDNIGDSDVNINNN